LKLRKKRRTHQVRKGRKTPQETTDPSGKEGENYGKKGRKEHPTTEG